MSGSPCLFCRIAARNIPAELIAETDDLLAFNDIRPQAPTHFLVIPKTHLASLAEITPPDAAWLGRAVVFATELARTRHLDTSGYRLVINCGAEAGQTVWHLHIHVLGGRTFTWPPG